MKQKRTRIAPNIYRYEDGRLEAIASAAGRVAPPTRWPAGTDEAVVAKWVEDAKKRLRREARELGEPEPKTITGTLRSEAPDFFAQIAGRPSTAADISHVRAWFEVEIDGVRLGDLPLAAWTTAHVNKAVAFWQTKPSPHTIRRVRVAGYVRPNGHVVQPQERSRPATSGTVVAAYTIRHRLRVLRQFFVLRQDDQTEQEPWTPVKRARRPSRPKTPPVTVAPEKVRDVLETLVKKDVKTFARFYVATATGQRPCQIGRALIDDVDIEAQTWLVRNAKGEPAHSISLNFVQIRAWRVFIDADAWGEFNTTTYGKIIHRAGWPKGIRPYSARHSLVKAAIQRGAHLGDVQGLLGHVDPRTTRIYLPFQMEEQQRISDRLAGRKPRTAPPKQLGAYLGDVLRPRAAGRRK